MEKNVKSSVYTYNGETHEYNYSTNLRTSDKVSFVSGVCSVVVDGNSYQSVLKDVMFNFMLIDIFTDIDMSAFKDIDNAEDFIVNTDIVNTIIRDADEGLVDELRMAVDKNIQYKTGIKENDFVDVLSRFLDVVENKIDEIDMSTFMESVNKVNGISDELTPEKILEAYANTDMFKKNRADRRKIKKEHKLSAVDANLATQKN